jgi:hypothetical protein
MKRKLEMKDIVGYLPHHLQGFCCDLTENGKLYPYGSILYYGFYSADVYLLFNDKVKPVLRPLSDLYKTITHNGTEIVPFEEIKENLHIPEGCWHLDERLDIFYTPFDYLNELKIDYRGLIDAGLAIDCNTLEKNPYE